MNVSLEKLKRYIDEAKRIVIVGHYNPDGDAVGASMGLYNLIANLKEKVQVVMPNPFPDNLKWMDKEEHIQNYQAHKTEVELAIQEADLLFCMDFQAMNRTEKLEEFLQASQAKKILIDHHIEPKEAEFDLCFSDTQVSSTCEICYRIVHAIYPQFINKDAASCFYAGICTDTGSFSFSCRHAALFRAVAELIDFGIDPVAIHRNIFDTFSEQRLRLLGYCLSERLVVLPALNTAYIYLNKKELQNYNYQAGDTEGIVNYALSMANVY
ncbi:MAG: DHH family phosphoesterase, partial [Bacteroidales bacterium]